MNISPLDIAGDRDARLSILSTIYTSMVGYTQEIRGTVERVTVWGCGLIFVIVGWMVSRENLTTPRDRIVSSCAVLLFGIILIATISALKRRFDGFAQVIRRVNEAQLVHQPGAYIEEVPLFPEHWKLYGSPQWSETIFRVSYVSLAVVTLFGIAAVWFL